MAKGYAKSPHWTSECRALFAVDCSERLSAGVAIRFTSCLSRVVHHDETGFLSHCNKKSITEIKCYYYRHLVYQLTLCFALYFLSARMACAVLLGFSFFFFPRLVTYKGSEDGEIVQNLEGTSEDKSKPE